MEEISAHYDVLGPSKEVFGNSNVRLIDMQRAKYGDIAKVVNPHRESGEPTS